MQGLIFKAAFESCRSAGSDRETAPVKKILLVLCALLAVGCNSTSGATGATKTYDLEGNKVSFIVPPAPWEEKKEVQQPQHDDGAMTDKEETVGVAFLKENFDGYFFIGVMPQHEDVKTDEKGKEISRTPVELENDQDTLDIIAMRVEKRDGERLKQEWIPLAGTNAFHMIFEVGPESNRQKGEQVHFTKNGWHYSLSMVMPVKDYDAEVGHFQAIVSSLKIESGAKPAAKPKAAP